MPANEKRRYGMTSDLRQYIAEYTVANFWRYPIGRRVTNASALEFLIITFGCLTILGSSDSSAVYHPLLCSPIYTFFFGIILSSMGPDMLH